MLGFSFIQYFNTWLHFLQFCFDFLQELDGVFCWVSSQRVMWSSPSKSPILLNLSGYRCLRSMALWIGWVAGVVAVWTMQRIVTSPSCLLLGSPSIAGPSDFVTKKSELCHSVSLCLQERVTTPSCFIVVPLYACSMVCIFFVVPSAEYPLGSSFSGNIWRNIRSRRMFPCAPVSTFTLRDAGHLYWMSRLV